MPMVVMNEGVNESSLNRSRQHDLPTPESPIRSSLIWLGLGDVGVEESKGVCVAFSDLRGSRNSEYRP